MKPTVQTETLNFNGKVTTQGRTRMIIIPQKHHEKIASYTEPCKIKVHLEHDKKSVNIEFNGKVSKKGEQRVIVIPKTYHNKVEYFTSIQAGYMKDSAKIQTTLSIAKW